MSSENDSLRPYPIDPFQDKIVQKSSNFEFFFENNLKEMKSKLDEKLNIQMKKISELSKNSQKERVLCFEKLQTQNY